MSSFLHALQFLTRLPGLAQLDYHPRSAGGAVTFYPAVGLVIGALLMVCHWVVGTLLDSPSVLLGAIVVVVWVYLTGALHLDGLADCADAMMGALDRTRFLEILKDTHVGVGAVTVIVLVLITKVAALSALFDSTVTIPATVLLLPALVARLMMAWLLVLTPYLRDEGLGADVRRHASVSHLAIATVVTLAPVIWLMPLLSCVALFAAFVAVVGVYLVIVRRIGGATGDVYGATVEVCETACLISIVWVI